VEVEGKIGSIWLCERMVVEMYKCDNFVVQRNGSGVWRRKRQLKRLVFKENRIMWMNKHES